jgi:hypothetical protein
LGLTGAAMFILLFSLTLYAPEWVETFGAEFIEREASKQVDETIASLQPPSGAGALSRMATALYKKNQEEIERHRESLRQRAHERLADAIAEIRNLDCECRSKWAQWLKEGTTYRIQLLRQANESLTEFIHATYAQIVADLKRDIRFFAVTNSIMFVLLLLVVFFKPQASLQLVVPGLLLAVATALCSYFYIFEQNWLLTIIYNDYLGYTYLVYLGTIFALLCDIVLNRARVSTEIVNAIFNAVGSAVSAVPC